MGRSSCFLPMAVIGNGNRQRTRGSSDAALFICTFMLPSLNNLSTVLPAAIHIDTGMSRLGLPAAELDTLSKSPELLRGIDIKLMMSHLISAEEASSPANAIQKEYFDKGVDYVRKPLDYAKRGYESLPTPFQDFIEREWEAFYKPPSGALF